MKRARLLALFLGVDNYLDREAFCGIIKIIVSNLKHKKMHRVVSTPISIAIISALAIFVATEMIVKSQEVTFSGDNQAVITQALAKNKTAAATAADCKVRAFQGEAKISAWKIMKNNKLMVQVAAADVVKLPSHDVDNFELIDATPEIAKKLAASSKENPVEIALSGFATKCDGTALACMTYTDGIFKSYLAN